MLFMGVPRSWVATYTNRIPTWVSRSIASNEWMVSPTSAPDASRDTARRTSCRADDAHHSEIFMVEDVAVVDGLARRPEKEIRTTVLAPAGTGTTSR